MVVRLFTKNSLTKKKEITPTQEQIYYLKTVMRRNLGDKVLLFNGVDGEWAGKLKGRSDQIYTVEITHLIRPQVAEPDIKLAFAPLKKTRMDFVVEKATELGVSEIIPVITERTITHRVNVSRIQIHVTKAAEQSRRLSLPTIGPPIKLANFLGSWTDTIPILLMDETGEGKAIKETLTKQEFPIVILTGPEGGFTLNELDLLKSFQFTRSVSLGPRLLRAETAAIAALSCCQALIGDWHG
ncbi:MAG: Ribosomal RNA small subunit methyltransferase E [Alphaproteobacteria bacterium MarineAlpha3_Bin5]|nr:16S rRNA (uracil(1498)-N(3))-methyltransferase [Magnetovibrio sp.]PPR78931.1 MAG: Ribosomal RNA small subunit methyltransferase E [Alphaproteobacteria bacterium MarineAlpha3_Bin5]|tara:strand:+ start:2539 stop:3261 length:723 start_codon:yes stop_codon:yes gene_type:complete